MVKGVYYAYHDSTVLIQICPPGNSKAIQHYFQSKGEQMSYYKTPFTDFWVADPQGVNTAAWGLSLSPLYSHFSQAVSSDRRVLYRDGRSEKDRPASRGSPVSRKTCNSMEPSNMVRG